MRAATSAEDGADVDNDRLAAFAENWNGFADEFSGRAEVNLHDRSDAIRIGFGESAVGGDAGVVDEDVEAAELIACCGEGARAVGRIRHVTGDCDRATPE